jgi:hypothetical protein
MAVLAACPDHPVRTPAAGFVPGKFIIFTP